MARIPRRDHTNSHRDVETFEKCLGRTPLAHVSVCVCCFSYQIFGKIGGKSKPQTIFLLFSNPLRSDTILESKVGCSVIPILEMSPCPAEVSCATGSSDGNATFTPNPTCVWHIGGPRGGRSLFSLCSLPLRGCAGASATSEALTVFLIIPVVSQGVPPSMASSGAEQIVLKSKKWCKMPV